MVGSAVSAASVMSALDDMSVPELIALIQAAEEKRRDKLETAKLALVEEFRAKALELGLSVETMFPRTPVAKRSKSEERSSAKLPAKYRGPNGEEWTGRGRLPKWLTAAEAEGKIRENFAI